MFLSGAVPIKKDAEAQVLMLGLGGGMMNSYLHHMYPKMNITVVEIDQKMYEVAVKWFDLEEDNRQRVIIMDGVTFLKNALKEGQGQADRSRGPNCKDLKAFWIHAKDSELNRKEECLYYMARELKSYIRLAF
ncbi:unnamed protein product [Heligmosomoides polygyrus]|uniref:PABS domain-containing protein n=1 Tax=Heligmosomoides polygyrus TaxID=6339 RepID=A0A183FVC2_HELPZ|nr:unnamed protein product [Heligmosomoides polygyrus]